MDSMLPEKPVAAPAPTLSTDREHERILCAHCRGQGACYRGDRESSCPSCVKAHEFTQTADGQLLCGLVCSVCKGRGSVEPTSLKIQNRFIPFVTLAFLLAAIYLIYHFEQSTHFDKVLVLASTIIGGITGYYFGGEKR
ncbi:MAG TPA: hypothetical protein VER08_07815 [Pyrinomonadaceae bacterium]|nr:hypothetical protein [Pyrinomonadaceae bacterium]